MGDAGRSDAVGSIKVNLPTSDGITAPVRWKGPEQIRRRRIAGCLGFIALLGGVYWKALVSVAAYAADKPMHSHILLVPFISGYLIFVRRKQLPTEYGSSMGIAVIPFVLGLIALGMAKGWGAAMDRLSESDLLALLAFSFVCFIASGGFAFLGRRWMAAAAFPAGFLLFAVPLPDGYVEGLETTFKLASAEAASCLFAVAGTPVLRDGLVFQLPGITLEVAQECSGVRSSWVLFMTGLLVSNLFLKRPLRRIALVAFVIPLGIIRNGFRILVIGLLCVHLGPEMINSLIHKRGGPLFFVLSLIPLCLLLWWLRRGDSRHNAEQKGEEGIV